MKCPKCGKRMTVKHKHKIHKKKRITHLYHKCPECGKKHEIKE